jgi:hypothetical protein
VAWGSSFEQKWLDRAESVNEGVLTVPDFTATSNLYAVVHNIEDIRVVPVGLNDVYMFVIAALIPCIPVFIAAIPFNILMKVVMKLLV